MSKKNRYADVRTFLCMVGIAVMIAGVVMGYIDTGKANTSQEKYYDYLITVTLFIPIFSFIAFVWRVPQLFAFSLTFLWFTFPAHAVLADTIRASHYELGTKLGFASHVMIMVGSLLSLAPILKNYSIHGQSLVAWLIISLLWIISAMIDIIKYKLVSLPVSVFILTLIFGMSVLRRSVSLAFVAIFISISIFISSMQPVIVFLSSDNSKSDKAQGVANLFYWLGAALTVFWYAFDFGRQGKLGDRIGNKEGEWRRLN